MLYEAFVALSPHTINLAPREIILTWILLKKLLHMKRRLILATGKTSSQPKIIRSLLQHVLNSSLLTPTPMTNRHWPRTARLMSLRLKETTCTAQKS